MARYEELTVTKLLSLNETQIQEGGYVSWGTSRLTRSGNNIIFTGPSSDPHVVGALYSSGGILNISAG